MSEFQILLKGHLIVMLLLEEKLGLPSRLPEIMSG